MLEINAHSLEYDTRLIGYKAVLASLKILLYLLGRRLVD